MNTTSPIIVIRQTFKKSIKIPGLPISAGKRMALPTTQYLIGSADELDSILAKVRSERAQITCIPPASMAKNLLTSAERIIKYLNSSPRIHWKDLKEILKKRNEGSDGNGGSEGAMEGSDDS